MPPGGPRALRAWASPQQPPQQRANTLMASVSPPAPESLLALALGQSTKMACGWLDPLGQEEAERSSSDRVS